MKFTIVCVGKLKEKYWKLAVEEYTKRLGKYGKVELIEVADEKAPETMSAAQENQVKKKEGERILKSVHKDAFWCALAIDGKPMSSEEFSFYLETKMNQRISHIVFLIGGSLGLSNEVLQQANEQISFSKMTFPHQMMRVILLEQIYRAMRIMKKEPYHK